MTRKPRSDAKLLSMPQHQQDALATWLLDEGISYKKALARLREDFMVESSPSALVEFWRHVCQPRRLRRSAAAATALPELSEAMEVDWEQGTMALLQQSVFEMLSQPTVDPEAVFFLAQVLEKAKSRVIKVRELDARIAGSDKRFEQRERELAQKDAEMDLAREKFAAQEARNQAAREKLTAALTSRGGIAAETVAQIEEALRLL